MQSTQESHLLCVFSRPGDIMTSTSRVTWVNFLRRDHLQACLGEFDLDITGMVQEMRRRWAQFMNQDHKPEVVARLLELQIKLDTLIRQRSPSPASPEADKYGDSVRTASPERTYEVYEPFTAVNRKTIEEPTTSEWRCVPTRTSLASSSSPQPSEYARKQRDKIGPLLSKG